MLNMTFVGQKCSHQRRQNNPETNSYGIILKILGGNLKYGVYHQVQYREIYYGITMERYVFLEKKKMQ